MADKRRHPRAAAHGIAAYIWLNEKLTSAIVENISAGGLFFRTPRPPERGTAVRVRLVRPGLKQAVELSGVVVSSIAPKDALAVGQVPGSGVRFNQIPAVEHERFDQLLTALGLPPVSSAQIAPMAAPPAAPPVAPPVASPAVAPAPPRAASAAPGAGFVDYRVHEAEVRIEAMPVTPRLPRHDEEPLLRAPPELRLPGRAREVPAPLAVPDPVALQVELAAPSRRRADESERLMVHVKGLMQQVAQLEEQLAQRDLQIDLLRQELDQVRQELDAAHGRARR